MTDWQVCKELPGWQFKTERFDYGDKYGIVIQNGKQQFGHRVDGAANRSDADLYADAIKALKAKIAS